MNEKRSVEGADERRASPAQPAPPDATLALGPTTDRDRRHPAPEDLARTEAGLELSSDDKAEGLSFLGPGRHPGSRGCLGPYEVLEVLGRGGFGVVLKAFDEKLHRMVAIKVLGDQLADNATARKRFAREARAAAAISNEHVVGVFAVEEQPVPHLVMEYVPGKTLQEKIDQGGPLEMKEVLQIGWQIASGLAAAHAIGVIHRDVKPGNILLEEGVERVKITDFGLARAADDASLTQSGAILGTPMYMSPEQAMDEPVDHRADLFSLGSVLYMACTGHPPFRAPNTLAVLRRVCEETPRPIREVNPDIPDWLAAIISKLHAKKPEARFQTAAEVADRLRQHLAHLRGTAPAPPPLTGSETVAYVPASPPPDVKAHPARSARRRWVGAAIASALTAVAALAALAFWYFGPGTSLAPRDSSSRPAPVTKQPAPPAVRPYDPGPVQKLPDTAELTARPAAADALKPSDTGGLPGQVALLGASRFGLPRIGMNSEMRQDRAGKWLAVPNGDAVALLDARTGALVRTFTGHTDRVHAVALSPDGRSLAAANLAGGAKPCVIRIWDTETGQETTSLPTTEGMFWAMAFAPDGKQLFTFAQEGMDVWDLTTRKIARTFPAGEGAYGFYCFGLSPDGKRLAWGDAPNKVKVWEIGSDNPPVALDGHAERISYTVFSPDGKWLASGSMSELLLWNAETLEPVKKLATPASWLAFEPGGATLLTAGYNHVVTRWDLTTFTGQALPALSRKAGVVVYLLGHDGKSLYSVIADDGKRGEAAVRAYEAATGKPLGDQGHTGQVRAVVASPDGKTLASASDDGTVRTWDLASGRQRHVITRRGQASAVAFSPDGGTLAAHWSGGPLVLIDAATGAESRALGPNSDLTRLVFSPDGSLVAALSRDGALPVWGLASGQLRHRLKADTKLVSAPAFRPDGQVLAAGLSDGGVALWDLATGERVGSVPRQPASIHWVGFHPDGRSLAVAGPWKGNDVPVYDLVTGREKFRLSGHRSAVASGAWRADGQLLATIGDTDGTLRLWNLGQSPPISLTVQAQPRDMQGLHDVALTPEGRYVAVATADGTIPILRVPDLPLASDPGPARPLADSKELASRPAAADALARAEVSPGLLKLAGQGDPSRVPPEVVAILGDAPYRLPKGGANSFIAQDREGKWLAVPNADSVVLFEARTGEQAQALTSSGRLYALAFSPDGKFLAGGNWEGQWQDKEKSSTVKVWSLPGGEVTATLTSSIGWIWSLAFSPDGKQLIGSGNSGLEIWDLATGKSVRSFPGGHVWQLGMGPHGKRVVTSNPDARTVAVINLDNGEPIKALEGFAEGIRVTIFSPDGKWLATGNDRELWLWDAEKLELVKKLDTPAGWVAFEPGGKSMLTASHDQTGPDRNHVVTRWDLTTFEARPLPSLSTRAGWTVFHLGSDGKTLYSLIVDGRDVERAVRVYDVTTGQALSVPQGHTGQVWCVAFRPDGKRLASVSHDPGVRIWDMATGKIDRVLSHDQGFFSVAYSADGQQIAAGEAAGAVVLYDARSGEQLRLLNAPKSEVRAVAFSPDGRLVVGTTLAGVVNIWEAATGRLRHSLTSPLTHAWTAAFSPDGKVLATGWGEGEVRLYDVKSGWELVTHRLDLGAVRWLGFHPDGRSLGVVGARGGEVLKLDAGDRGGRGEARTMPVRGPGHLAGAWRADGLVMASCGERDGLVRLWSTDSKPNRDQAIRLLAPGTTWLHGIDISPEGRYLATANPNGTISVLRLAPRGEVFEPKAPSLVRSLAGHTGKVVSAAYSPDGQHLASGSEEGVRLWDARSGQLEHTLSVPGPGKTFVALAFTPDGKYLLAAPSELPPTEKNPITLWDVATGQRAGALEGHVGGLWAIAFTPDGKSLVSAGQDAMLRVWDLEKRAESRVIPSPSGQWVRSVVMSSSGTLAVGTGDQVYLLDAAGRPLVTMGRAAGPLAFSPDGKRLAGVTWKEGQATVWDTQTGREVSSWKAHDGVANGLAFSRDGRTLATAGGDQAVRLWDLATQRQRAELSHDDEAYALTFSPDGANLATTTTQGRVVQQWDVRESLRSDGTRK